MAQFGRNLEFVETGISLTIKSFTLTNLKHFSHYRIVDSPKN